MDLWNNICYNQFEAGALSASKGSFMKTIIELIDNTKQNNFLDNVYVEGYSHRSRLLFPNKGQVYSSNTFKTGSIVFFYNFGMQVLDGNRYIVSDDNVFMVDGALVKKGVVASKKTIKQGIMREQEWFVVEKTSCEVPEGAVVICKSGTAYKFNDEGDKRFINVESVLFYVDKEGTKVTDDKILLDRITPGLFQKQKNNCGTIGDKTFYTRRTLARLNNKLIVNKSDIYAEKF